MKIENIKVHKLNNYIKLTASGITYISSTTFYHYKNVTLLPYYLYSFYKDVPLKKIFLGGASYGDIACLSNLTKFKLVCLKHHSKLNKKFIAKKIDSYIRSLNAMITINSSKIEERKRKILSFKQQINSKQVLKNNLKLNIDKKQLKEYLKNAYLIEDILDD